MKEIYLDNAATTSVYPAVAEQMDKFLREEYYNPSSFYKPSVVVEKAIAGARRRVASSLAADPSELYFTSGATESNNTIIRGAVEKARGDFNIITSSIEHPSVMRPFEYMRDQGVDARFAPVDSFGNLDLNWLEDNLNEQTKLVSIMGANNEIGTIADLPEIKKLVKEKAPEAIFHTDMTQGYLKSTDERLNLKNIKPDAVSVSAHKIHGPKGIGAMAIRKNARIAPLLLGGGQERSFRSGTENVHGIIGFATAVEEIGQHVAETEARLNELKNQLFENIKDIDDSATCS